jgi:hypothetical protein
MRSFTLFESMLLLRFVSILGSGSVLVAYIDADVGRGRDGCSVLWWVVVVVVVMMKRFGVEGRGEESRKILERGHISVPRTRLYGIVVEGRRRQCLVSLLSRARG